MKTGAFNSFNGFNGFHSHSWCLMLMAACLWVAGPFAHSAQLRVMTMGLGSGRVTSAPAGIDCGGDCNQTYVFATTVTLTAMADSGSIFVGWEGDGTPALGGGRIVNMGLVGDRSVRAIFDLTTAIPTLTDFTATGISNYLATNLIVTNAARFVKALPTEYKQNWLLMSRSESLQTGIAESPRLLLPSADARFVFTIGMKPHSAYPGSHSNAVEYMQWDAAEKNFRFHEIVLHDIEAMGDLITLPDGTTRRTIGERLRGVSVDDAKCFACHSTRNVLNRSSYPGTTGVTPGTIKWKNKPNWDTYDSWAGLMPFNRDRIYQGSVEAAAFRKLLNWWTWRDNHVARGIIEQLELQPPGVPAADVITRTTTGGPNDGHINFAFDTSPPVLSEPPPSGPSTITTAYSFDGLAGMGAGTVVTQRGSFVTLHHSGNALNEEGRAVQLFDLLGGLDGTLNQQRITDELISHRFATGSHPIDVRPVALAIARGWIGISGGSVVDNVTGATLMVDLGFFDGRHVLPAPVITSLSDDTRTRAEYLPRRKADMQKKNLDRSVDVYLASDPANGLIQQYGAATSAGTSTVMSRLRQEVFRRRPDGPASPDQTAEMGGIYPDVEDYSYNTPRLALFRYFLEPLGVSVDKWSMGVRGRSRTYTFADVFDDTYIPTFRTELAASLVSDPIPGLTDPNNAVQVINAVNSTLSSLPDVNEVPRFTDVQRIFNKSCIECHGGLLYPPYRNYVTFTSPFGPNDHLDLSEDENPPASMSVSPRLERSYAHAVAYTTAGDPAGSYLYQRITMTTEDCPYGLMPCGGPALNTADIDTIRRWILGPPVPPFTVGDPHIRTVDGVNYDFQAVGEFVLLRDELLEIQTRQTAVATDDPLGPQPHSGLTSCVSVNTAVAVRIGGDRVSYQPNLNGEPDPSGLQLRINGKLMRLGSRGIPLPSGGRVIQTIAPGGIQVEAPGGAAVIITPGWWNHYQVWYLNVDARNLRATMGLMGAIPRGSWLPALPDGSFMGPRPANLAQRYSDLYDKFGKAWRVTDTTSLFDYAPGTSTATFTIESWPGGNANQVCIPPAQPGIIERPPQKPLPLAEAQRACAGIVDPDRRAACIQDVMVTGELGFATTYLLADQIDRNNLPKAPDLVFPVAFPSNALTRPVTFTWNHATDKDGDPLSYRLYVWAAGQIPNNNNAEPVSTPGKLSIRLLDRRVVLEWLGTGAGAQLESASRVTGPWNRIANAVSPHVVNPNEKSQFYRLRVPESISMTVSNLQAGQAYFWKVITEDDKGGTVESETRRFEVK